MLGRKPLKGSSGNLNMLEESVLDEAGLLSWAVPTLRLILYYSHSRSMNPIALLWKKSLQDFHVSIRKHFSTMRVVEHWNRLPREVVEPSSMEIIKTWLETVPRNLFKVTLLSTQGSSARQSPKVPANLKAHVNPTGCPLLAKTCYHHFNLQHSEPYNREGEQLTTICRG